jgi:hypothetical protein
MNFIQTMSDTFHNPCSFRDIIVKGFFKNANIFYKLAIKAFLTYNPFVAGLWWWVLIF